MAVSTKRFLSVFAILAMVAGLTAAEIPRTGEKSPAAIGARLFRDIARRQNPTVVSIAAHSRGRAWDAEEEEMFRLLGVPPPPADRVERRLGSGFLISAAGEILTNSHVVEGADFIEVTLFGDNRKRYRAGLVGHDPVTDSALIRLDNPPADLPVSTLGDSSRLEPGDWVMAIGDPFRLGHTVTVGFVSFQGRPFQMLDGGWQDLIQTDAALNPGNSGGPLIDIEGNVVGINVAILDSDTGGNAGIGFAIPINTVKALLPQLRRGKVVRGYLPVRFHDDPIRDDEAHQLGLPRPAGALIMSVDGGSTAATGGLRAGDVVVALDGKPVEETRELLAAVSAAAPGTKIHLTIIRAGEQRACLVEIGQPPGDIGDDVDEAVPEHDPLGGLTLGNLTGSLAARLATPHGIDGAVVVDVRAKSPADEAELGVGDIVRAVNGRHVRTAAEASAALQNAPPHAPTYLLVWRHGAELFLKMRAD
jgi:serine protease Do